MCCAAVKLFTFCAQQQQLHRLYCHTHMTHSDILKAILPWFWDLLVWNWCPHRLAVPLLFEFATEGLFYVIHVERTNCRAGDAVEENNVISIRTSCHENELYIL